MPSFLIASLKGVAWGVFLTLVLSLVGLLVPVPEGSFRTAFSWRVAGVTFFWITLICWAISVTDYGIDQAVRKYRARRASPRE